mmetsp:Transcript_5123/g.15630  ORF Transcript_5123/g.15630 Transcript_5123/m.15630 type:complete len:207 (+) Transcript_5123:639-1259(+)
MSGEGGRVRPRTSQAEKSRDQLSSVGLSIERASIQIQHGHQGAYGRRELTHLVKVATGRGGKVSMALRSGCGVMRTTTPSVGGRRRRGCTGFLGQRVRRRKADDLGMRELRQSKWPLVLPGDHRRSSHVPGNQTTQHVYVLAHLALALSADHQRPADEQAEHHVLDQVGAPPMSHSLQTEHCVTDKGATSRSSQPLARPTARDSGT